MKEYVISSNEENKRLDKYLKTILPKAPDSFIYKMLRKKNIKLNDIKASGNEKLKAGDIVKVFLSDDTILNFKNSNNNNVYISAYKQLKNIDIVYEDNNIIILNKPSNTLSQKSKDSDISINEWVIGYLLINNKISVSSLETFRPSILNRLDRNTKGLIIASKSLKGAQEISYLLKNRDIKKFYHATVKGQIKDKQLLEGYLYKDPANNKVSILKTKKYEDSDYIKTLIYPIEYDGEKTKIEIELITGKTHQIRAHLSSIKHPILGDPKYGDINFNKKYNAKEQDLTAVRIEFPVNCKLDELKGKVISL